jgi:hypothetical protein
MAESLQSQVNNFTFSLFGDGVTKVDVSPGIVAWELPCSLDTGLPDDPRSADEGVACYFLRLLREEIEALRGPKGEPGLMGLNGFNGYTVSIASFTQPTNSTPFIIRTIFNPVIKVNEIIFVGSSGWYQVLVADDYGNLTVTLVQPQLGASGVIAAGKLIIPTGPKGQDLQGPHGDLGLTGDKGDKGLPGDKGIDGENGETLSAGPTQQTGSFVGADDQTDFVPTAAATLVNFTPSADTGKVTFRLTSAGKYLFRFVTMVYATGSNPTVYAGLVDTTNPANNTSPDPTQDPKFLPGSFVALTGFSGGSYVPISSCAIVTTTSNYTTIELQSFGKDCRLIAPRTTVTWVRVT